MRMPTMLKILLPDNKMRIPTILKILLGNKKAACGLAIVVAFVLMAIFAPLLASNEPTKRVARPHQPPSAEFVMGSTRMGHDIWAQFHQRGARLPDGGL